jgi:hypothetical protein
MEIYWMGTLREHHLPLRRYDAAFFVKNGVPVGYFEGLTYKERMEVGFNLYYTFREGESAWLFARTLRLARQLSGATCFSIDPYQIGYHNEEAIDSGSFWFYRKLGFRPTQPEQLALVQREEREARRSSPRTLRRLAASPLIYEIPGTESGRWDHFSIRPLAQKGAS